MSAVPTPNDPDTSVRGCYNPSEAPSIGRIHELAIESQFLVDVLGENKRVEMRRDDRNFKVDDFLLFVHKDSRALVQVTHILRKEDFKDVPDGYCLLSIRLVLP